MAIEKKKWYHKPWVRRLLFVPPIVAGVLIAWFLTSRAEGPQRKPATEVARELRVITAPAVDVVPRVLGYGTAKPARVWRAVSEVGGRVITLHPRLRAGEFIAAGELAFEIDRREYELAVKRFESELARVAAQMRELETQASNDRASLEIEQSNLQLAQAELERIQGLAATNTATPTEVRQAEQAFLSARQAVLRLENALELNVRQLETAEASKAVTAAQLEQAKLDLSKTSVRAPFTCRLQVVNLELDQFVQPGQLLFEADGTEASEINAQVPIGELIKLMRKSPEFRIDEIPDFDRIREVLDISATARLSAAELTATWDAELTRIREQLDPTTRAVQVVVRVNKPYEGVRPGVKPPLVRGAYCEVELRGGPLTGLVIVPRAALDGDGVWVVNAEDRLERRSVDVLFRMGDFATVSAGVNAGERVVAVDPSPAIAGQLVAATEAEDVRTRLLAQARGEAPLK